MAQRNTRLTLRAAALAVAFVFAACGGRLGTGARAEAPDPTSGSSAVTTAEPSADRSAAQTAEPTLAVSSARSDSAASAKPTQKPTAGPTPTPVPTPDLAQLERLLGQLDAALTADEAVAQDEGSLE